MAEERDSAVCAARLATAGYAALGTRMSRNECQSTHLPFKINILLLIARGRSSQPRNRASWRLHAQWRAATWADTVERRECMMAATESVGGSIASDSSQHTGLTGDDCWVDLSGDGGVLKRVSSVSLSALVPSEHDSFGNSSFRHPCIIFA